MKVVVYLRCSSSKQDTSIARQWEQLEPWLKSQGYTVVKIYTDEGKSGSVNQKKRTDFWRMIRELPELGVDGVVVWKSCRFGRLDSTEGEKFLPVLREHNVKLVSMCEQEFDLNKGTDRMIWSIMAETNNAYSWNISRSSLEGKLKAIKDGNACACGGSPAYSLVKVATDTEGREHTITRHQRFTVPKQWHATWKAGDKEEVETVRWLFNEFDRTEVSYNDLAKQLNDRGVPSGSGGRWSETTVRQLLRKPVYCGAAYIGDTARGKFHRSRAGELKKSRYTRPDQSADYEQHRDLESLLIVHDVWEGIVSRAQWQRVRRKIEERKESFGKPRRSGREYPLNRLMFCGACGHGFTGKTNRELAKGRNVIYRCSARPSPCPECNAVVKEHEILPGILKHVADELLKLKAKPEPKQDKEQDNSKAIEKTRKAIETTLWKLRSTEDKELYLSLQGKLKGLRADLAELGEQGVTVTDTRVSKAREWADWLRTVQLTWVRNPEYQPVCGGKFGSGSNPAKIPVETKELRAILAAMGLRLDLYFRDTGKRYGRWQLDKVRLQAQLDDFARDSSACVRCSSTGSGRTADPRLDR